MTFTLTKSFTFDAFVAQSGDNFRYELADGSLIDMESTGRMGQKGLGPHFSYNYSFS